MKMGGMNMSTDTKYDLEKIAEVVDVLNRVEERKKQAGEYSFMASTIVHKLGKGKENDYIDHFAGNFERYSCTYEEKGLVIKEIDISYYTGSSITISTSNPETSTSEHRLVFRTSPLWEIDVYRPGEWERRFKELYESIKPSLPSLLDEKIRVPNLSRQELEDLKSRFGLE